MYFFWNNFDEISGGYDVNLNSLVDVEVWILDELRSEKCYLETEYLGSQGKVSQVLVLHIGNLDKRTVHECWPGTYAALKIRLHEKKNGSISHRTCNPKY